MSDQLIASQGTRISELERERAELQAECKRHRLSAKDAKAQVEELTKQAAVLTAERDDFKARAESGPKELRARIDELTGQVRERDHRDAWREAMGTQLADKASVEDVWAKVHYQPGEAVPTPDEITEQVQAAREAAPYLFKPTETVEAAPGGANAGVRLTPTGAPPGNGRGTSPHVSGVVKYAMSETRPPGWQQRRPELARALANGTAVCIGE